MLHSERLVGRLCLFERAAEQSMEVRAPRYQEYAVSLEWCAILVIVRDEGDICKLSFNSHVIEHATH